MLKRQLDIYNKGAEAVAEEYVITLSAIINSFSLNMPEAGKYYTFSNGGYYITSNVANDRIACSETKDATFDVEVHEAVAQFPAPTEEMKNKVIDCTLKGYKLHEKVIRHAQVVVGI